MFAATLLMTSALVFLVEGAAVVRILENDCNDCFPELVPVCTLDGRTFKNFCHAKCANATIFLDGECNPNMAAKMTRAKCQCPDLYTPVCGTDCISYSNDCAADCGGAKVAFTGPCPANCSSSALQKCDREPAKPVCGSELVTFHSPCHAKAIGATVDAEGACSRKLLSLKDKESCMCSTQKANRPVCGTDRRPYIDECFAKCAGVQVAYYGQCMNIPESAHRNNWQRWATFPVCGTDNQNYENLCAAKCAGVGVEKQSSC